MDPWIHGSAAGAAARAAAGAAAGAAASAAAVCIYYVSLGGALRDALRVHYEIYSSTSSSSSSRSMDPYLLLWTTNPKNLKSSNGRKIARMARNWMIFGPNRSRRRELFFEKFRMNERANKQTKQSKQTKGFQKKIEKTIMNHICD